MAPWCAVEALYSSAERNIGPIGDCAGLELALTHHAKESLYTVEETLLVVTGNDNLLVCNLHEVTLGFCRDILLVLAYLTVATYTDGNLEVGFVCHLG